MRGESHPTKIALRDARQATMDRLTTAFVADELSLEEYEDRVNRAYRCRDTAEFDALTSDLTPPAKGAWVDDPAHAVVRAASDPSLAVGDGNNAALAEPVDKGSRSIAVLGNTLRRGRFRIDGSHAALSVLGNLELDLREVMLNPGITTLHVRAVLGSVEITVPPSLIVDCDGTGVLGSFSDVTHMPAERGPDEPVLRIVGSAILGSVEVRTLPSQASLPRLLPDRER